MAGKTARRTSLVAGVLGIFLASSVGQAFAYPTTPYDVSVSGGGVLLTQCTSVSFDSAGGEAWGGFIWYDRSVGVQGGVDTNCYADTGATADSVTVRFTFLQGDTFVDTTTRTTHNSTSYNFTEGGPVGGITEVEVTVCDNNYPGLCSSATYSRP